MITSDMVKQLDETLQKDCLSEKWDIKRRLQDFNDDQIAKILHDERIDSFRDLVFQLSQTVQDPKINAHLHGFNTPEAQQRYIDNLREKLRKMDKEVMEEWNKSRSNY